MASSRCVEEDVKRRGEEFELRNRCQYTGGRAEGLNKMMKNKWQAYLNHLPICAYPIPLLFHCILLVRIEVVCLLCYVQWIVVVVKVDS